MSRELGLSEPALVLTACYGHPDNDGLLTVSEIRDPQAQRRLGGAFRVQHRGFRRDAGRRRPVWTGQGILLCWGTLALVSNWSVPSKATVKLVIGAVEELTPSIGRAEALRRAEMAMLNLKNPPEYAHLLLGPFILVGEGGAGR